MSRKTVAIAALLVLAISSQWARAADPFDFRKVRWGMPRDQVMRTESGVHYGSVGNGEVYTVRMYDREMYVIYEFGDNGLDRVAATVSEDPGSPDWYVQTYRSLQTSLSQKYADPDNASCDCRGEGSKKAWLRTPGRAVASGMCRCLSTWTTDRSDVRLFLRKGRDGIDVGVSLKPRDGNP
ncbi:MAG: hypothetical protein ACLFOY_13855 [Desulfatibacillaceae bacterium]